PISWAIAPKSGVVATTFSFATAVKGNRAILTSSVKLVIGIFVFIFLSVFICIYRWLKFVRPMRPQQKFDLQPNRMFRAKQLPVIIIVLQPQLRELARVKSQIRRKSRPFSTKNIFRVKRAFVA